MNPQFSPTLASPARSVDPARCPLCGKANDCQRCTSTPYKGSCWCERLTFPDDLAAQLPEDSRGLACVCRACVVAALRVRPQLRAGPGESYLEPGSGCLVFTEAYHRQRGYCCENGCRHCPWSSGEPDRGLTGDRELGLLGGLLLGGLLLGGGGTLRAGTWVDDFSADPVGRGWQAWGATNRFFWNAATARLDITWDTTGPHSFFTHALEATLTAADDFSLAFELHLDSAEGGVREGRPGAMQVAVGLINLARATTQNYARGAGRAFETVEFNWFPEGFIPGFGTVEPTLSAVTFDDKGRVAANFAFPFEWPGGTQHQIKLSHQASPRVLTVEVVGSTFIESRVTLNLPANFGSFSLDAVAIIVWDEHTSFGDSLRASGSVDNLTVVVPDPPIGALQLLPSGREVEFVSQQGWSYSLEAGLELGAWQIVGEAVPGTGKSLRLFDARKAAFPQQFYRVRADRK